MARTLYPHCIPLSKNKIRWKHESNSSDFHGEKNNKGLLIEPCDTPAFEDIPEYNFNDSGAEYFKLTTKIETKENIESIYNEFKK